jgi:hypothetical protein
MPQGAGRLGPSGWTTATESSIFSGRVDDSRTTPSVETLNRELGRLIALGLPKLVPRLLPALFALHFVQDEIHGGKSEDQILGLETALRKATCLLACGGGPEWRRVDPRIAGVKERATATEALIGLDPATRWLSRPARQRAAALAFLDPAYEVDTFRRRHRDSLIYDLAYAVYKLERHLRFGIPLASEEAAALRARGFAQDADASASHGVRIIRTNDDLTSTLLTVVQEAREYLVTTGSRSRDLPYLQTIESRLLADPNLIHYRVLFGPPHWQVLKDHLMRLIVLRSPSSRPRGPGQTLFLGIVADSLMEPEAFICANERHAFVRLPSLTKVESWDTGIELTNPGDARAYFQFVEGMYRLSKKIDSRRQVAELPVLRAESPDDEEIDE